MTAYFTITGIITIVIAVVVGVAAIKVTHTIRNVSDEMFGTRNLIKGLRDLSEKNEYEMQNEPKSVSAMTSLYLPQIKRDFPDFNYDEMKSRSQGVLISYLKALENKSVEDFNDVTPEFRNRLEDQIEMAQGTGYALFYKNPKIHRTEISNYTKRNGKCIINFQTSIQYNYYKTKHGDIVDGGQDILTQSRYDVSCIYIQDRDKVEEIANSALGINCPNCGAPIGNLGAKSCAYCGSAIIEFNMKSWYFSDVVKSSST